MAKETKLNQIIPVQPKLEEKLSALITENIHTFNRTDIFLGTIFTYDPLSENEDSKGEEKELLPLNETKMVTANVPEQLNFLKPHIVAAIDVVGTKEASNSKTKTTLNFDDKEIEITAPELLALDKRLKSLKQLLSVMPTIDASKQWEISQNPDYRFVSTPPKQYTTRSIRVVKTYPSPDNKHAPYVDISTEQVKIGYKNTKILSSELSSKEKSNILQNLDILIIAVADALQRANDIEIIERKYGEEIINFLFKPVL